MSTGDFSGRGSVTCTRPWPAMTSAAERIGPSRSSVSSIVMSGAHLDELRAEAEQMRRRHLAVDHVETAGDQLVAQPFEGDFRSVALDAEH